LRFGLLVDLFFFLAAGAVAAFFLSSFKNLLIILVSCSLSFEVRGVSEEEVEDADEEEEEDDVDDDDEDSRVGRFGLAPVFLAGGCLPDVPCWVGVEAAESAVALRSRSEACRC
jgi:hypothetical protein